MLRIGIITDIQYGDLDAVKNRDYRASAPKFLQAAGALEEAGVDAVFHLGDAFDRDWNNLTAVSELLRLIRKPFYNLLGNHDYLVSDDKKLEIGKYLLIPDPRGYYSFTMTDSESGDVWRFLFLNGNEISLYAAKNDEERTFAEKVRETYKLTGGELPELWNGAMTDTQFEWIDAELADAGRKGESVIICSHFPLFSQGGSKSITSSIPLAKIFPVYYGKMGCSQWNADRLLEIMDSYPDLIKGYWAGHLHAGAYGVRNGVPHITFQGMVETNPNAWAVMELKDGKAALQDGVFNGAAEA